MYITIIITHTNIGDNMIDFAEIFETITRALISLLALYFVTRLIGKKQVSELSLFDYVIGISIGNFAAEMTINLESKEINGVVAVVIFGLVAYLVSYVTMKSIKLRRYLIGVPTAIINKGKINYRNLQKAHIDINDLLEQARINGYYDLSEIDYAFMEANGTMSFKLKSEYEPVTNKDLNISKVNNGLCANIIIDGNLMKNNIKNMNKDINYIKNKIETMGYKIENILLATLDEKDNIKVFVKGNFEDKKILE